VRSQCFDDVEGLNPSVSCTAEAGLCLTPAKMTRKSSEVMPLSPTCVKRKYKRKQMKLMPMASSVHASAMKLAGDCMSGNKEMYETQKKSDPELM